LRWLHRRRSSASHSSISVRRARHFHLSTCWNGNRSKGGSSWGLLSFSFDLLCLFLVSSDLFLDFSFLLRLRSFCLGLDSSDLRLVLLAVTFLDSSSFLCPENSFSLLPGLFGSLFLGGLNLSPLFFLLSFLFLPSFLKSLLFLSFGEGLLLLGSLNCCLLLRLSCLLCGCSFSGGLLLPFLLRCLLYLLKLLLFLCSFKCFGLLESCKFSGLGLFLLH